MVSDDDFAKGIAFIVRNKDNLLLHCAGPTEAYVVEQTLDVLAALYIQPVETQPGSPNFDGATAYEAHMDARPREVCSTCNGTKRAEYEGYGWCTCETCTAPPFKKVKITGKDLEDLLNNREFMYVFGTQLHPDKD